MEMFIVVSVSNGAADGTSVGSSVIVALRLRHHHFTKLVKVHRARAVLERREGRNKQAIKMKVTGPHRAPQ